MRILLDENFPADFAKLLVGHDVSNVHSLDRRESRTANYCAAHDICEVLVTLDRNLELQQNVKILSLGIVVVRARSNRIADLVPYIPEILQEVTKVGAGRIVTVGA
jgi:hypothetical protein